LAKIQALNAKFDEQNQTNILNLHGLRPEDIKISQYYERYFKNYRQISPLLKIPLISFICLGYN